MKYILQFINYLMGWKHIGDVPEDIPKCVLVGAQHTSNWDFLHGVAALSANDRKPKFLIKKELFFFPLNIFFKSLGGIPVDRSKSGSLVDAMVDLVNEHDRIVVLMTPEGTRSYVKEWKSGFYHLAKGANIPIVLGSIDFAKKETRIGPTIYPSDNKEQDMKEIKAYYAQFTPRHPENGLQEGDY